MHREIKSAANKNVKQHPQEVQKKQRTQQKKGGHLISEAKGVQLKFAL